MKEGFWSTDGHLAQHLPCLLGVASGVVLKLPVLTTEDTMEFQGGQSCLGNADATYDLVRPFICSSRTRQASHSCQATLLLHDLLKSLISCKHKLESAFDCPTLSVLLVPDIGNVH